MLDGYESQDREDRIRAHREDLDRRNPPYFRYKAEPMELEPLESFSEGAYTTPTRNSNDFPNPLSFPIRKTFISKPLWYVKWNELARHWETRKER